MKFLVLSTYPSKGSRNSGDDLISKSLIKLMKSSTTKNISFDVMDISKDDDSSLETYNKIDILQYKALIVPAFRPTLSGWGGLNTRLKYMRLAFDNNIDIYAPGAAWTSYPGSLYQSKNLLVDENERALLQNIFKNKNNILTSRDVFTQNIFNLNNIPNNGVVGDLALFDREYIKTPFKNLKNIKNIAISMPHNRYHYKDAIILAKNLRKIYNCKIHITYHGYIGSFSKQIKDEWRRNWIEFVDLSGGAERLEFYEKMDIHFGFRLHAHIFFLRIRKPSFLIAEDGRSLGHLYTINGLGVSAAPRFTFLIAKFFPKGSSKLNKLFKMLPIRRRYILKKFQKEIKDNFLITRQSLAKIDFLWGNLSLFIERVTNEGF